MEYIPLDKSWMIRMGILDLVNGYEDTAGFLSRQAELGDDLKALQRATESWKTGQPVDVGESGTIYRLLKFASWKLGAHKEFVTRGTLSDRQISDDPSIVRLSQSELLKLDNGTSQWASAAALMGDTERISQPPFKLALTYEAIDHWNERRSQGLSWEARRDATILGQAEAYRRYIDNGKLEFVPEQAEDFCFAYAFGAITAEEGESRWPALRGHESDRIEEMRKELKNAEEGLPIASKDHRVVQAIAMWGKANGKNLTFLHSDSVNKSWPLFWEFLKN